MCFDPVAADQAAVDMINCAIPLAQSKASDRNVKGDNILKAVTGVDPQLHIDAAYELGLGNKGYKLITVNEKDVIEKVE